MYACNREFMYLKVPQKRPSVHEYARILKNFLKKRLGSHTELYMYNLYWRRYVSLTETPPPPFIPFHT